MFPTTATDCYPPSSRLRRASLPLLSRHSVRDSLLLLLLPLFSACGGSGTPLDADTRQAIDSISTAQINLARKELDTLCQQRRAREMPHLVDSIKQKRLHEIQEQLKTVPK